MTAKIFIDTNLWVYLYAKNPAEKHLQIRQKETLIMNETNPVVLQVSGKWHIVEHSRRSTTALCGQNTVQRGAHARLSMVGEKNLCPKCLKLFKEMNPLSGAGI